MPIRLYPKPETQLYECFDCRTEFISATNIEECPRCGAVDKFHEMR